MLHLLAWPSQQPNRGVQVMPLARLGTWRIFYGHLVPPAVPSRNAASGTPDAKRWAVPRFTTPLG
jgi:hypothetical protein